MKLNILKGATDVTVYLFIQSNAVSTGAGLTGLAFNTASLTCYYVRPLGNATQLTLATQTVTGAHSDGGFVEVDATNMPGVYRLDLSDAIVATGVNSVVVLLKGAANMATLVLELQLVSYNPNDAVRLGLTALPNANAEAAGGLYTRGSGAGQINQQTNGQVDVNLERWLNTAPLALSSQQVQAVVPSSTVVASVTGAVGSVTGNVGGNVNGNVVGSVGSVTAPVTVGTNNDKTGYSLSAGGVDAIWDEVMEGTTTARMSIRLANSANGAIVSGAPLGPILIRDLGDTKDRVTATVDGSGNRTAVTLDLT